MFLAISIEAETDTDMLRDIIFPSINAIDRNALFLEISSINRHREWL